MGTVIHAHNRFPLCGQRFDQTERAKRMRTQGFPDGVVELPRFVFVRSNVVTVQELLPGQKPTHIYYTQTGSIKFFGQSYLMFRSPY